MSDSSRPSGTPADPAPKADRRVLRNAWISVALIPVAFVVAMLLGDWLLSLQGYESGSEQFPPVGVSLLAGIPALVVMIAPAVTAMWFGLKARRQGLARGIVPAVIGGVFIGRAIITNLLPRLLGA